MAKEEEKIKHQVGVAPKLYIRLADGDDIGFMFTRFEWASFVNGGYIIRATLQDPYWNRLKQFAIDGYLDKGRKQPTQAIWEISWPSVGENGSTGKHVGYITDVDASGIQTGGQLTFVAVDPPSFWLNAGDASGKVYEGSVKQVIEKVINDYFIGPNNGGNMQVSNTLDSKENQWWMMRQDPKTFIQSLLEWSASITEDKTNWIVSCNGAVEAGPPSIWIKEQAKRESKIYGTYIIDARAPAAQDLINFQFMSNNFISIFQKQLITHGISAISGRYFDRKLDDKRNIVHVRDENTDNKKNANIDGSRGFDKPGNISLAYEHPYEWATSVMSVPEFNGGELGITYDKYIDGRARARFLDMLNLVMRIKIRITGEQSKLLADSHNLGVSALKIIWIDADHKPYFLDGNWLVYGFHHVVTRGGWFTDVYCHRLDWNAEAKKVGK